MNTVEYLNALIRAKRDMCDALKECDIRAWGGLKIYPEAVSMIIPKDSPLVMYDGWSFSGSTFKESPIIDVSNMTSIDNLFYNCTAMNKITMIGNPSNIRSAKNAFEFVIRPGTLYYDSRYDYSLMITFIPDSWSAKPFDYVEE